MTSGLRGTALVAAALAILVVLLVVTLVACGDDESSDPPTDDPTDPTGPSVEPDHDRDREPEVPPPPPPPPSDMQEHGPYQVDAGRDCDGFPYLALETPPGLCVGIVFHSGSPIITDARGRFRPRSLLADPERDDVMWLLDFGARRARAGRLWRITHRDGEWHPEAVISRLDRPIQLRLGPDGWIYIGEVQRIVRVDPSAEDVGATREVVIDDLPIELPNRPLRFHPMTSFVFSSSWDLIVNMGSGTDHCSESLPEPRCADERQHYAALWRYRYQEERRWSARPEYIAHGLRNSVALAAHPSGAILQAENGTDFREESSPHEELNVIEEGRHYGWPYCFDRDQRDPRWTHSTFSCDPEENAAYTPPHMFLPAHGSPLDMLYYDNDRLASQTGRLLMTLHGYRAPGHRLVSLSIDANGIPTDGSLTDVIAGWNPSPTGPRGSPVGMASPSDGSVWLVEDTNGTVLRLSTDTWAASRDGAVGGSADTADVAPDEMFAEAQTEVLEPRCGPCHDFLRGETNSAFQSIRREGWLHVEDGEMRVTHRTKRGARRRMPPGEPLTSAQSAVLRRWFEARAD